MQELFATLAAAHPVLVAGGIFAILLLCGFGLPLPEDVVLAFTGYAVHRGVLPMWLALGIGLGGVLIGDSTLWYLGHRWGEQVMSHRLARAILPPARRARVERLFRTKGSRVLFSARFTPVLRAGFFLFAGWTGVSYLRFILTDGSAAVLSVPAIIVVTYLLGDQIDRALAAVRHAEHWILGAIALLVVAHLVHAWITSRRDRCRANKVPPTS